MVNYARGHANRTSELWTLICRQKEINQQICDSDKVEMGSKVWTFFVDFIHGRPPRQPRGLRALDRGDHLFARLSRGGELGERQQKGGSVCRTDGHFQNLEGKDNRGGRVERGLLRLGAEVAWRPQNDLMLIDL